jgi:Flp pilus assembly protein TadB
MPKQSSKTKKNNSKVAVSKNNSEAVESQINFVEKSTSVDNSESMESLDPKKETNKNTLSPESRYQMWQTIAKAICIGILIFGGFDLYYKNYQDALLSVVVAAIIWPNFLVWDFRRANIFQRMFLLFFVGSYIFLLVKLFTR